MLLLLYLGCRRFTIVEAGTRFLILKNHEERLIVVPDTDNQLEIQDHSNQQVGIARHSCWIVRCWLCMSKCQSIPNEEPMTDQPGSAPCSGNVNSL
jgi:hypothetical protein